MPGGWMGVGGKPHFTISGQTQARASHAERLNNPESLCSSEIALLLSFLSRPRDKGRFVRQNQRASRSFVDLIRKAKK
jgi:hypothetical protein